MLALPTPGATAAAGLTREPIVPEGDSASVFSPYAGAPRVPKAFERTLGGIENQLGSEKYDFHEYFASQATYTNFVGMARSKVIVFLSHGVFNGGFVVQVEPTRHALDAAYAHYVGNGCRPCYKAAWISRDTFVDEHGRQEHDIMITPAGIKHFFSHARLALVAAFACESAKNASNFHALSYIGYRPCVQFINLLKDGTNLFARLTGAAGIDARTTVGAVADMRPHDGLALLDPDGGADPTPVALSPAVFSVGFDVATRTLDAGADYLGTVRFDAEMNTSHPDGTLRVSGCGASIARSS